MKKPMQCFLSIPIAHRGLHSDEVAENSLKAFSLAVANGYGMEFDVHLTADNQLVIMHDYNTKRVCEQALEIEKSTLAELRKLNLRDGQLIPTLQEVLAVVNGQVPIVIELKCPIRHNPTLSNLVLKTLDSYPNKELVCLESFHPICVRYLKKHTDVYPVGQLATGMLEGAPKPIAKYLGRLKMLKWNKADFVCYDIKSLPNPYVERARNKGMPIITYTIDTYDKLDLAKTCTDNIIFEKINPNK